MARGGGEEKAFADGKVGIFEGKTEIAPFAAGGLVRLIEHAEVEAFSRLHGGADGLRGLVGGEDDFGAGERGIQKAAHAGGIGGDLEVEVGLCRGKGIQSFLHRGIGTDAEIGEAGQGGFAQPFVEDLAQEGERGNQNENPGGLSPLGNPKGQKCFATAAGHNGRDAIVRLQGRKEHAQAFDLVRHGLFLGCGESGIGEPGFDGAEVVGFQAVEVGAANAEEPLAFVEDGGQVIAVREQDAAADVRAIGQAHEGGEFAPGERGALRAELDLVGAEVTEERLENAIHAVVLGREAERLEGLRRHGGERPDLGGIVLALRSQISFGKDLEGVAA